MAHRKPPRPSPRVFAARLAALALVALVALGCDVASDPLAEARRSALGPEDPRVPPGEFHRPGQPCVLCHGPGGAAPEMSVGGTVFATPSEPLPVEGARVRVTDSAGEVRQATTNCVGNFFFVKEAFDPLFPLGVVVEFDDPATGEPRIAAMGSRIGRDGSCASCHRFAPPSQNNPGWVYCDFAAPEPFPELDPSCPGRIP